MPPEFSGENSAIIHAFSGNSTLDYLEGIPPPQTL